MVSSNDMLQKMLGAVWRGLPRSVRRTAVRVTQQKFTATAGAIIFDGDGRILLLDHVFRPASGWGIPGGFISHGEQPEETLRREIREEVGIEIDDVELAFVRTLKAVDQVEIFFRCRARGEPKPQALEIRRHGWYSPEDLPRELTRDQRGVIARALAGIGAGAMEDGSQ
jgi:8-oxo-dGTP diphosphatase